MTPQISAALPNQITAANAGWRAQLPGAADLNVRQNMWTKNSFRLFVSHVSAHKETAQTLKTALQAEGISAFVAHEDIQPTREWQDEIESALRSMDALAALLTPDFHSSLWTDQEVGFAIGTGRLVLPMRLGQDPYGFIGKFQGLQISEKPYVVIAAEIRSILSRHGTTARKMAEVLTSRFESTESWGTAKQNIGFLEECAVIDEELLARIEAAPQQNCQILDAWGVPDRITKLVASHRKIGNA